MDTHRPGPETSALQRTLLRHEVRLVAYATRLLGDLERARDVVQDTFLELCRDGRGAEPTPQWLYTVCRNRALDVLRKEQRMTSLDAEQGEGRVDASSPATRMEQQEELGRVEAGLAALPPKQGEALRLKFQHGLSYREIAGVMEESAGTVGWWIHEGLKSLRTKLASGEAQERGARA